MKSFRLHAIAAMSANRVIGRAGELPWHLPEDLKLFKRRTLGHPIIMGRNTYFSLPKRPLPGRRNIVLSKSMASQEVEVIGHLDQLHDLGIIGDAYLIGGAQVFAAHLQDCDSLILSLIHQTYEGDTYFPEFEHLFRLREIEANYPEFEVQIHERKAEPDQLKNYLASTERTQRKPV